MEMEKEKMEKDIGKIKRNSQLNDSLHSTQDNTRIKCKYSSSRGLERFQFN